MMAPQEPLRHEGVDLQVMKRNVVSLKFDRPAIKNKVAIGGLFVGGVVGFLLRPSVPFMGQLPFTTVIARGANLRGFDQLLTGYARTSFNYLVAGMVLGAAVGLIAAFVIARPKS